VAQDTDDALINRALAAYFRIGENQQLTTNSYVYTLGEKRYVVLSNDAGPMAVYRIRGDGILRRMRRWPKELDQ
jgi:hypothetical protein